MAIAGTLTYPPANFKWGKDERGLSMRTVANYIGPGAGAGGYVTGGDAIAAGDVKLGTIEFVRPALAIATTGAATAVIYMYNLATGKLQAFWQTGAAAAAALPEVTSGTDLSDYAALLEFEGRG